MIERTRQEPGPRALEIATKRLLAEGSLAKGTEQKWVEYNRKG
ncbi:MAG TPA: hypothetical protein VE090_04415 [Methylomirabilota bacterium]|nr:hypothetical protein [Methylomirabilota bacterium]